MNHRDPHPSIEIVRPLPRSARLRHALFDFDGTLSLIREGWQGVMAEVMTAALSAAPLAEPPADLARYVSHLIHQTTGQATILQMARLAQDVAQRGGRALTAEAYKQQFRDRLALRIADRLGRLAAGEIDADALMVPGSRQVLELLAANGVICSLASGTDHEAVLSENGQLGLGAFFEGRVYGARTDAFYISKAEAMAKILDEYQLAGEELLIVGDGVVEIEEARKVGAVAVGVALDERSGVGVDPRKRASLIAAGADAIVPDFRRLDGLAGFLFPA